MLPDRVSNLGPLTYESGALSIALRGPALNVKYTKEKIWGLWPFQEYFKNITYYLFAYFSAVKH